MESSAWVLGRNTVLCILLFYALLGCDFGHSDNASAETRLSLGSIIASQERHFSNLDPRTYPDKRRTFRFSFPGIRSFQMDNLVLDSLQSYEAGDCAGRISNFSSKMGLFLSDSCICGPYGYDFRYYISCYEKQIKVVYTMDWTVNKNSQLEGAIYVLRESIVDFNEDETILMQRIDTMRRNYTSERFYRRFINKPFQRIQDSCKEMNPNYWINEYREVWTENGSF